MTIYDHPAEDHLCQGDIIFPSDIRENLVGHQDYFADAEHFVRFLVLTQTCDLAREKQRSYIQLCVVRRLSEAFGVRHLDELSRSSTKENLKKLLRFQDNKRGYFYLPESPSIDTDRPQAIEEPCVADLRVTFSLHETHHDDLVRARCGSLNQIFVAHLGHMLGSLFNRVALPPYDANDVETQGKMILDRMIQRVVDREKELRKGKQVCAVRDCTNTAKSLRDWPAGYVNQELEFAEHAVCLEHAKKYDARALSKEEWLLKDDPSKSTGAEITTVKRAGFARGPTHE